MSDKIKYNRDTKSTSISFLSSDLARYKAHAKSEGMAFSKLIRAFFEQDIADKEKCKHDPKKTIERIRIKRDRLKIVGDDRLDSLNLDELLSS